MGKTYRERLIDTLNRRDPGQVVVDLGSTSITGININALVKLRKGLGLEDVTPVMDEPLQLLGRVDEDLRQAVGAGVIGVNNGYTIFGYKNRDWKEWTLHNGLKVLVSEEFRTSTDERGNTYILNPVQTTAAGMDARMLKEQWGDKFTFWGGGINTQQTLPFGTPEECYNEAMERLEIFAPGGGFVFNTVHNIQGQTPMENMLAMFQAVKDYNAKIAK